MRTTILIAALLTSAAGGAYAARQVHYAGIHPVPAAEGGGICHIGGPHVHVYPADKLQYREHDGDYVFVGDPVAYGWDGPHHAYKGHHPIDVQVIVGDDEPDIEWCYLDGPHYHAFAPAEGPDFVLTGGAYFYVGKPPKAYLDARPAMVKINAVYRPLAYTRPVVTVAAPAGWIGANVEIVTARPKVVRPVRAVSPALWVDVDVIAPAVIIRDDHDHHHHHHHHHEHKHKKHRHWDD
jgi:hypothetical protein